MFLVHRRTQSELQHIYKAPYDCSPIVISVRGVFLCALFGSSLNTTGLPSGFLFGYEMFLWFGEETGDKDSNGYCENRLMTFSATAHGLPTMDPSRYILCFIAFEVNLSKGMMYPARMQATN
uniref:Uncharacterized protein n=1 Tax=Amphora coffeiformis TaxID=265554 RepID=A0A7S3L0G6_9STRA|mmetsp:Transcript_13846/g.26580  ORF Transcript_13846/g.26580 Transcript_13846/m.26580 type:complete len:122 (-) Transcript_13846:277-642(-)